MMVPQIDIMCKHVEDIGLYNCTKLKITRDLLFFLRLPKKLKSTTNFHAAMHKTRLLTNYIYSEITSRGWDDTDGKYNRPQIFIQYLKKM